MSATKNNFVKLSLDLTVFTALFRRTRAALLHLPTIEKGRQPMTATEEELDYEIRLSQ